MPRAKPRRAASLPAAPAKPEVTKPGKDLVYVHGASDRGLSVVRFREDQVEVGELRPPRDGEPLHGELLRLHPREDDQRLFDCEVVADARKPPTAAAPQPSSTASPPRPVLTGNEARLGHKGPTRATTEAYRTNWDAIFTHRARTGPHDLN